MYTCRYCRENELSFFNSHPVFHKLPPTLFGVEQLSKKLTTVLVTRIKQELVSTLFIYMSSVLSLLLVWMDFFLYIFCYFYFMCLLFVIV